MRNRILIQNVNIVNEGKIERTDLLIEDGLIHQIGHVANVGNATLIDGTDNYLLPGIIDGQVHFRDPGPTHKGIYIPKVKLPLQEG